MPETSETLVIELKQAADNFDRDAVNAVCARLISWAWQVDPSEPSAEAVATAVRDQRCWRALGELTSALIARGHNLPMVRSCLVQGAIDAGELALARGLLEQLRTDYPNDSELLGLDARIRKQEFVSAVEYAAPLDARRALLNDAFVRYLAVYRSTGAAWHGINAVALAMRAKRDEITLPSSFDAERVAAGMMQAARGRIDSGQSDAWDFALFLESAIALGRAHDALTGALAFASSAGIGAFTYASTLRQLREIWSLDEHDLTMRTITGLLEAKIMSMHGGASIVLRTGSAPPPGSDQARDQVAQALAEIETPLRAALNRPIENRAQGLERTFEGRLVELDSLRRGLSCADAVAWLANRSSKRRLGSGFLLQAELLDPRLGPEPVLVTNAHVLDRLRPGHQGLTVDNALVGFENGSLKGGEFAVRELVWSSPEEELDVAIARITPTPSGCLAAVAQRPPAHEPRAFVYVIGHPHGGALSISLMDNLLLDYDDRVLHYRSATEPGCSGAPVLDFDWQLVGLHHAGLEQMPRLNGRGGTYNANEGIRFDVIRAAFRRFMDGQS